MPDPKDPDLHRAVDRVGRTVWGLGTRLFGARVVPPPEGEPPPLSPGAEAALDAAGATLGRYLHAAGRALDAHPMDPAAAVKDAQERVSEVPEARAGETVLTAGVRELGGGLFRVAEGVLDVVAPRRAPEAAAAPAGTPAPSPDPDPSSESAASPDPDPSSESAASPDSAASPAGSPAASPASGRA